MNILVIGADILGRVSAWQLSEVGYDAALAMITNILFVFWFFLPAGMANMAPIFAAKLPWLRTFTYPLDGYATFRGRRIFGSHKTLRGLFCGILVGVLTVYLQIAIYMHVPFVRNFVLIDYTTIHPLLFGMLSSVGALGGDAIKSFFKRQLNITPGKSWFPFDQIDYVIGGVCLTSLYIQLTLPQYIMLFVIWSFLHPLATLIGYFLKLKESPI